MDFTHNPHGYFTGTGANIALRQTKGSHIEEYGLKNHINPSETINININVYGKPH